jgi:arylformamidase
MLYRGMSRAELDAAYNNSAAVKDYTAIKLAWNDRSARIRRNRRGHLDIAYGTGPRQRLDLFRADTLPAPTLVFIHGGYWQRNDKTEYSFLAEGPLAHGINVAVLEYTLAPAARMDQIVAEIRLALTWLAEHLQEYGGNPGRIYVSGHSAGGHLTAMTIHLGIVKGGIAISGLYELEPIRLNYLNDKIGLDAAEADRNSPIAHLPASAAPLLIAYGTAELPELCRQSIDYARAWSKRGLPGRLLPIEGANHFTVLESLASPDGALTKALVELTLMKATAS